MTEMRSNSLRLSLFQNKMCMLPGLIAIITIATLIATPVVSEAAESICAPTSMLKIVTSLEVPGAPKNHFVSVPKTLYRYGERYGRVEEAYNPETKLHLLIVVSEPDVWLVDLASHRGEYQKDTGPTYCFRSTIFGNPDIQSDFINKLGFGCEIQWLLQAGAKVAATNHAELGEIETITFSEGNEVLKLLVKSAVPKRPELYRDDNLLVAVRYVEFKSGMPLDKSLFVRPVGIVFPGERAK